MSSEPLSELAEPEPWMYGSRLGDLAARRLGWWPGMIIEPAAFERWRWLRRDARRGVRTLDAGCGSGWFALYLAELGNDVTGISFNELANQAARRRAAARGVTSARFIEGDLRRLHEFGPALGEFDQIICFETIEHIRDDEKLMVDLAARLRPGGRLLLTTPSDDHPALLGEEVSETEDGGHVRFGYSEARLRELCAGVGLHVVQERRVCGWLGQKLYNATRRLTPVIGFRAAMAVTVLARPLQLADGPITRRLGYPGLSVGVIAEKPVAG